MLDITDAFPSSDFLLILRLNAVKNPSYERNWAVAIKSFDASGRVIEVSGASNFGFRTVPGALACELLNVADLSLADSLISSTVVGEYTDL